MLFLILGILDLAAGGAIIFNENLILPFLAKYIGLALIMKGLWTILLRVKA